MNSFSHRTSDRGTAACAQIGLPIKKIIATALFDWKYKEKLYSKRGK
jgi:hypothetical protein